MTNEADFSTLGLSEQMLEAVRAKGFETPTSIQRLTIPRLLSGGNDIIAQSQTGTGKTAAFGLPILQQTEHSADGVQALVLVPTRELAVQAAEELLSFNAGRRLSITAIYGGAAMSEQLRRLSRGVDIVVGTPGRVLDHIRRGTLKLDKVRFLVLDEADEMLDMGFLEDVEEIMNHTGADRRVLLFSATMPERIVRLSEAYMRDTEMLRIESQHLTADLTNQIYFEVREADKFDALTRIIDIEPDFYGIVFCRTKIGADEVATRLASHGYAAEGLHGDVSQAQREKILRKFRDRTVNILVATDVAARGIDVSNLSHVINYSLPQDSESYVHRIGRTGRAGREGTAITFISGAELRRFNWMMRDIKADIRRETLPSPQDIVAMKRAKIKEELREIVESESYGDYADYAAELLETYAPDVALGLCSAGVPQRTGPEQLSRNPFVLGGPQGQDPAVPDPRDTRRLFGPQAGRDAQAQMRAAGQAYRRRAPLRELFAGERAVQRRRERREPAQRLGRTPPHRPDRPRGCGRRGETGAGRIPSREAEPPPGCGACAAGRGTEPQGGDGGCGGGEPSGGGDSEGEPLGEAGPETDCERLERAPGGRQRSLRLGGFPAFRRGCGVGEAPARRNPKRAPRGAARHDGASGRAQTSRRQGPQALTANRKSPENRAAAPGFGNFTLPDGGVVASFGEIISGFRIKWLHLRDL